MSSDVQIIPKEGEDNNLMFHFEPNIGEKDDLKKKESYQFISCMLRTMMKDHEDIPEIGLIGDVATINYVLAYAIESFVSYKESLLWDHLMTNFDRGRFTEPPAENDEEK
jgi:hypothetical protein